LAQQWINGLKNQKTKQPTAARTKENSLRQITSPFNFARRQKYVAAELALELSEISAPRKQRAPIGIYGAVEMRAIFAAAEAAIIPARSNLKPGQISRKDSRRASVHSCSSDKDRYHEIRLSM
jgi:hypothetical protein